MGRRDQGGSRASAVGRGQWYAGRGVLHPSGWTGTRDRKLTASCWRCGATRRIQNAKGRLGCGNTRNMFFSSVCSRGNGGMRDSMVGHVRAVEASSRGKAGQGNEVVRCGSRTRTRDRIGASSQERLGTVGKPGDGLRSLHGIGRWGIQMGGRSRGEVDAFLKKAREDG